MNSVRLVVALLLLVIGLAWIGQGIGVIGGSPMSGQSVWAVIGAVAVVTGAVLLWTGRRAAWR